VTSLTLAITAHRTSYLTEAVLSAFAQTSHEFELLCCADVRASDAPLRLFEDVIDLAPMRERRVLPVKGNGTAGFVRNAAFAATNTPWLAFLDGDDFLHPEAIAAVLQAIEETGPETNIYSTGLCRVERDGMLTLKPDSLSYYPPRWIYDQDPDQVGHLTYFNHFQIVSRRAWQAYAYDDTTNGEDIDFLLHHLLLGRYSKIERCLYYFRDTPNSFSAERFEGGDVCTRRYQSGYYSKLKAEAPDPRLLELNFAKNSDVR
jgi:glycosyltransferase involved in cell wall biosynthesis